MQGSEEPIAGPVPKPSHYQLFREDKSMLKKSLLLVMLVTGFIIIHAQTIVPMFGFAASSSLPPRNLICAAKGWGDQVSILGGLSRKPNTDASRISSPSRLTNLRAVPYPEQVAGGRATTQDRALPAAAGPDPVFPHRLQHE